MKNPPNFPPEIPGKSRKSRKTRRSRKIPGNPENFDNTPTFLLWGQFRKVFHIRNVLRLPVTLLYVP